MSSMCSKKRKKQLTTDLLIIVITMAVVLVLVVGVWGSGLNRFASDQTKNIVLRVAVIGICCQYGLAGLGLTIVCLIRREKYTQFGLTTKKINDVEDLVFPDKKDYFSKILDELYIEVGKIIE